MTDQEAIEKERKETAEIYLRQCAEIERLRKLLRKLSDASVTPMDKRRYDFLEAVRAEAEEELTKH